MADIRAKAHGFLFINFVIWPCQQDAEPKVRLHKLSCRIKNNTPNIVKNVACAGLLKADRQGTLLHAMTREFTLGRLSKLSQCLGGNLAINVQHVLLHVIVHLRNPNRMLPFLCQPF